MKKLLMTAALVAGFALCEVKAQRVNGVQLSDIRSSYIEIRADRAAFANKTYINLQYGQKIEYSDDAIVRDDDNKKLEFNSVVDALNKFKSYGYELFQAYPELTSRESSRTVYLLKRQ